MYGMIQPYMGPSDIINHVNIVRMLSKEDPQFYYSVNDAGESPLYIAAERERI